jgi:cobaltochelatase CobN
MPTLRCTTLAALGFLLGGGALSTAAEPSARFGFIGLHGGVFEQLKPFEDALDVRLVYLSDEDIADRKADLSVYQAVFFQHLRAADREAFRSLVLSARDRNPRLRMVTLSGSGQELFRDLPSPSVVEQDPELSKYYGSASKENLRRFLVYALVKYAGRNLQVEPLAEEPRSGLYHPDHPGLFATVGEFLEWSRQRGLDVERLPRAAIAVHAMHLALQQPRVVDALVRRLEKDGVLAAGVIDTPEGPGASRDRYEKTLLEYRPGVVIHTCHSPDTVAFRETLGCPHLHSIFFRKSSIDQWRASLKGLETGETLFQIASQEPLGAIEPQIGAGTLSGGGSSEAFVPIEERIDHLVRRAVSWLRLGRLPNAEKRVAIVYYDREMGKSELMRGSATGMFLNAPRSLVKVLQRMKDAGYAISPLPADEDEMIRWMMDRGRQVGVWAPGELDRLVRQGSPALVPAETYETWLRERVPPLSIRTLVEKWGAPPGRFLVWEGGRPEKSIVIPRVDLGNVVLLPQPLRGESHDTSLVHDRLVPPPHNYLATYFWLEKEFHADAIIHFGTHGSELLLPGKSVGLSDTDWSDIVLGAMPNINPWVINNLGESMPAKRRAYAVLCDHLTPPVVHMDISDELLNLHGDIDKWEAMDASALKEKFRVSITRQARETRLDKELRLDLAGGRLLTEEEIGHVADYLHQIRNEKAPVSLHVLGEPPRDDLLVPYLVACLRKGFLDGLAAVMPIPPEDDKSPGDRQMYLRRKAEEVVRLVVRENLPPLDAIRSVGGKVAGQGLPEEVERGLRLAVDLKDRFQKTGQEIDNLLAALSAKFISPGPGSDPIRNPGAVPTGRNLYVLNPEEVPSRPSWQIGKDLVDRMLKSHRDAHGRYPQKVGFDLSSFATFTDYGVMESQILYLIGVEPVWDEKSVVADVKVIPRDVLGRPRIDVFISALSYYRDNLPSRMVLIDKAIRKVAALDEPDNGVRTGVLAVEEKLVRRGVPRETAVSLSKARIFGYPAGQYGSAGYYYLVEKSGEWDTREQLMDAYLSQVKNVYTEGSWGEPAPEAYEESIQGTEVVLRTWADNVRGPLSNKYTWYIGGSLSLAVKHLTGKTPEFLLSDVRDTDQIRMTPAEDAMKQELRVRLFNRKWIEGMMKEGYAGADQVAVMVSNAMGWEIMREGSVTDDVWKEIKSIYLDDRMKLSIREWFEAENPFAFQEVSEILLESVRKGYWKADEATVRAIAEAYAASVGRHGEGGGLRGGGNVKLGALVEKTLTAPGDRRAEALLAEYRKRSREIAVAPSAPREASAPPRAATPPATGPAATAPPAVATPSAGKPPSTAIVEGRKIERVAPGDAPRAPTGRADPWQFLPLAIASACGLLLLYGFLKRRRA